jgi:hypothetical protein
VADNIRKLRERSDRAGDPIGLDVVTTMARKIMAAVGDPTLHFSIPVRVARAIEQGLLSPQEVGEVCDIIIAKNRNKELERPGAYFITSMKRLFQRHEIPWRNRPKPGTDFFWGNEIS